MTVPVQLRPHMAALRTMLTDAGFTVGDHQAPVDSNDQIITPCVILRMGTSRMLEASLSGPPDDALIRFRLLAVGITPDGAADYADQVAEVVHGAHLVVADREIYRLRRADTGLFDIELDQDVTPPVFYAPTPYQMMSMTAVDDEES